MVLAPFITWFLIQYDSVKTLKWEYDMSPSDILSMYMYKYIMTELKVDWVMKVIQLENNSSFLIFCDSFGPYTSSVMLLLDCVWWINKIKEFSSSLTSFPDIFWTKKPKSFSWIHMLPFIPMFSFSFEFNHLNQKKYHIFKEEICR